MISAFMNRYCENHMPIMCYGENQLRFMSFVSIKCRTYRVARICAGLSSTWHKMDCSRITHHASHRP